jgi:hypothetical protein
MDPDCSPPAYSLNDQEFDQKVSQATTLSLHLSQTSLAVDEDGWPQYDPAAFEAAEGSSTSPSAAERSSSDDNMQHGRTVDQPSVVPLRIEKKSQPKSLPNPAAQPKNESSSLTIGENSTPTLFSSKTSNHDDIRTQHHSGQRPYAEDTVSLMPLAPVQHYPFSMPPPVENEPPTSIPESRPIVYDHYDHDNHYQQYVDPYNITPSQSARQFQSRSRLVPQERPGASYSSAPNTIQPSYLDFNPSIAYGRTQPAAPSLPLIQPVKNLQFDPHSLYNSAVSAHITPVTTVRQGHPSYSSYNFPPRQYQQGSSETNLRPGGRYSQSYVPQDSLSTGRSSAPSEMNSSRRPALQSSARPPSNFSMSINYQSFNSPPSPVFQYVDLTANVPGNIYYDQSPENRWTTQ